MANRNESIMSAILNPHRFSVSGGGDTPAFGGASRDFNGSSHIIIPSGAYSFLDAENEFTIAAWFKADAAGRQEKIFSDELSASGMGCYMHKIRYNNRIEGGFYKAGSYYREHADHGQTVTDWLHYAVTWDGSDINAYVNGTNVGSNTGITATSSASGLDGSIGRDYASNYASGRIADVRLYTSALSSGDISNIADGTHVATDLRGWWCLDSDDVDDHSGNDYDGTNSGSTYSTDGPLD